MLKNNRKLPFGHITGNSRLDIIPGIRDVSLFPVPAATPGAKVIPPLPEGVETRLAQYASLFGVKPSVLISKYRSRDTHYSLESVFAVGSDPLQTSFLLAGKMGILTGTSNTFGYTYFHIGLVRKADELKGPPYKRTAVFGIDTRVAKALKPEPFAQFVDALSDITDNANHDPLHSLGGELKNYQKFDCHYRYGGIEFAPIVVHAAFIQNRMNKDGKTRDQITSSCARYPEIVRAAAIEGDERGTRRLQMHLTSIYLRHLLLLLPSDHEIVRTFLAKTQEDVFRGRKIRVSPKQWQDFLHKNFSDGDHKDEVSVGDPAHDNRTIEYNHGKNSMMRPWLKNCFAEYFGENIDTETTMPYSTFILLDAFKRGYGTYSIVSAFADSKNTVSLKTLYKLFSAKE